MGLGGEDDAAGLYFVTGSPVIVYVTLGTAEMQQKSFCIRKCDLYLTWNI